MFTLLLASLFLTSRDAKLEEMAMCLPISTPTPDLRKAMVLRRQPTPFCRPLALPPAVVVHIASVVVGKGIMAPLLARSPLYKLTIVTHLRHICRLRSPVDLPDGLTVTGKCGWLPQCKDPVPTYSAD